MAYEVIREEDGMSNRHWMYGRNWAIATAAVLLASFLVSASASADNFLDDRIYIVVPDSACPLLYRIGYSPPKTDHPCLDTLNEQHGYIGLYDPFPNGKFGDDCVYVVVFPDTVNLDTIISDYLNSGCVDDAFLSPQVQWESNPNDTLFLNTGGISGQYQWGFDENHSRLNQAWDITTGDSQIVVAVIDQGLSWKHPDLEDNVWINSGEDDNGNGKFEPWDDDVFQDGWYGDLDGVDSDGNGYIDDVVGIKIYREDGAINVSYSPIVDLYGDEITAEPDSIVQWHGTFVASIIGAVSNNSIGMAGGAGGWSPQQGVKIMAAVPAIRGDPFTGIINAAKYAIDAGADVISMSFAFLPGKSEWPEQLLREFDSLLAVAYFDSNMICVAAAGNIDTKDSAWFPAAYGEVDLYHSYPDSLRDFNRVLGVGSLDSNNVRCTDVESAYGIGLYDFGAPGYNWGARVTGDRGSVNYGYQWCNLGKCATSWATPVVSAIAALVWSAFPELDNSG